MTLKPSPANDVAASSGKAPDDSAWRCYLCGGGEAERVARNIDFGLDVFSCLSCGLTQTDYVSEADLEAYYRLAYSDDHGRAKSDSYTAFSKSRGLAQRRFIEQASDQKIETILDFGAGAGGGVHAFSENAKRLVAFDPDPEMQGLIKKNSPAQAVSASELFSGAFDGVFDLVIVSHVLEHLPDPRYTLGRLSALLKDEGLLFIEVPHESPQIVQDIMAELKTGTGHLFHFNRVSLKRMVEADDLFQGKEIKQCGPSFAQLKRGEALNPDAGEHSEGIWLRGLFQKKKTAEAVPRNADKLANVRRFAALHTISQENASLRAALRRVYASFLNIIELPSKKPGPSEAISGEGPVSSEVMETVEAGFREFKTIAGAAEKLREKNAKLQGAADAIEAAARQKAALQREKLIEKHTDALARAKEKFEGAQQRYEQHIEKLRDSSAHEKQALQQSLDEKRTYLNKVEGELRRKDLALLAAQKSEAKMARQRAQSADEARRLRAEIDIITHSTTFRLGRILMTPFRIVKTGFRPKK